MRWDACNIVHDACSKWYKRYFEGDYAAKYVYAAYIKIISSTQSLLHATRSYFSKLNDIMQKIRGIEYFKKF